MSRCEHVSRTLGERCEGNAIQPGDLCDVHLRYMNELTEDRRESAEDGTQSRKDTKTVREAQAKPAASSTVLSSGSPSLPSEDDALGLLETVYKNYGQWPTERAAAYRRLRSILRARLRSAAAREPSEDDRPPRVMSRTVFDAATGITRHFTKEDGDLSDSDGWLEFEPTGEQPGPLGWVVIVTGTTDGGLVWRTIHGSSIYLTQRSAEDVAQMLNGFKDKGRHHTVEPVGLPASEEALREALEPFARLADSHNGDENEDERPVNVANHGCGDFWYVEEDQPPITRGDFRRALRALRLHDQS